MNEALGAQRITGRGHPGYAVTVRPGELDAARFVHLARTARQALAAQEDHVARERAAEAIALWRGSPFADLDGEPALRDEASRLEHHLLATIECRTEAELRLGNDAFVITELCTLVDKYPYHERLRLLLMIALHRCGRPWADAITLHTTAVHAAQHLCDRLGEATALHDLGDAWRRMGDHRRAAQDLEQALGIFRDLGDRVGQANALGNLGYVRRMTDDYTGAARHLEQALSIFRDLGDRGGEAAVLNEVGALHRVSGDPSAAEGYHQQALELARAIASPWDEAHALAGLGRCVIAAGQAADARESLRQAHEIFQRIGAAEAPAVLAELTALIRSQPTG